ncbi:MAG: Na+/H+ antiporter, NhaA family protein nonfunctional [Candidatus Saccharibacteria bacterium]|nr:Na+/H+ antiporter, NhaA family protein nonfunctional [Candidatus Saccharibacteria bacterium]
MSKQFWIVIAVIVLAFAGVAVFSGNKSDKKVSSTTKPTSHIEGPADAKVTLVEYGDYQCPYCLQYFPTLQQVTSTYKDKIKFQFRNFPLTSIHQNAFAAARAAEAADKQGKFWEMHDLLYESRTWVNDTSPSDQFLLLAQTLKLDTTKFQADYKGASVNDLINADLAAGDKLGITGTPTFFVNGKQVDIGNSTDSFKQVIDAELTKQGVSTTTTTSATPAQ